MSVVAVEGTNFAVRNPHYASELRKLPEGTWPGPALGTHVDGGLRGTFEDLLFIDDEPRDKATQHKDWRNLTLWADPRREEPELFVRTERADDDGAVYLVEDPTGTRLARITRVRGAVAPPRRTAWSVEVPGGAPLSAVKGGAVGWFWWWLFSPVWAVMAAVVLFGGEFPRMPLRTRWRRDGVEVFELLDDGTVNRYQVNADFEDIRVLYGLAALHHALPTVLGGYNRP
jgi:hypothetical protein